MAVRVDLIEIVEVNNAPGHHAPILLWMPDPAGSAKIGQHAVRVTQGFLPTTLASQQ
jgi:hypothetical protein